MGWGRMLLLGDWGQQLDIQDQRREIDELRAQLHTGSKMGNATLEHRVYQLEQENSELRLYLASLIKYLGHKGVLKKDEFRTIVDAVDLEDGAEDGGYRGKIV